MEVYTVFSFNSLHAALCIADTQQPLGSECADGSLAQDSGGVPPPASQDPSPSCVLVARGNECW